MRAALEHRGHTVEVKLVGLLVVAAALAVSVASARAVARPALRLMDASPVAFRGTGFKPHERVRISVYAGERAAKRVVASVRGRFVVRFSNLDPNACAGFGAVAVGNEGSRAVFKRSPGMCPAP
jgi:hypothetical protein